MNTFYHSLKGLWGKIRYRYNYSVISDADGSTSFALLGNASGRNPYCRTYLGQRDFPNVRSVWYRGGTAIAPKLGEKHGLVVLSEIPAAPGLLDEVLHVPNFIALGINLPSPGPEAYMKSLTSGMRSNIRIMLKKNFMPERTRNADSIAEFYHRHYRPTMLASHGDEAYVHSEQDMLQKLDEPGVELIRIMHEGTCVGGVLCQRKDYYYHLLSLGWLNGDPELRRAGVPSSFYWHSICRAYELGCTMLNVGGTPPYLESGVTRFKLPWGATFCKDLTVYGYRDLLLNPADPHCYRFLEANSILAYGIDNCLIVLSSKRPDEAGLRESFLKDVKAWYLLRSEKRMTEAGDELSHLPARLRAWYELYSTPS